MIINDELPTFLVEESIATLEKTSPFTDAEMHPCRDNFSVAEIHDLIEKNTRCVESLTKWKGVIQRVLEPDAQIILLEKLVDRKLIEASSIISSLSPTIN